MTDEVGFIGLGVLGSAIAKNLVEGGFRVRGADTSEAARQAAADVGVEIVEDTRAAADAPIVFVCLASAAALQAVAADLARMPGEGRILVELGTFSVADKERAREPLARSGWGVLDCPVSGNRIMALERKLTAFCSGERADYEAVRGALSAFCRKELYVGPFGNGIKTKLCGNILNLVHNTVAAEAMVLAMKSGLDPVAFHEAIAGSGSSSAMFDVRGAMMAAGDYAREGMNMSVPLKDAPLIADHAASVGAPIPLYQLAVQFYRAAQAQGLAHLDAAVVCKVMERLAGCERP
ncbi:NAD(P)-dependent oxidoreductase [Salinarimonas ramus]|uniref:2-hydroxy-3-oxopropionate reductase n=1 Tax=Salinarimonas ramus TaxID=690164 RepID=A0A917Q8H1_9HYPH|nr:NAD(P)-dependent oxidoreductase [Salinarimonas ramus]GGK35675.1 2-hydroxy-3-oxopropionate reductase [Salinarimonas ramus]